MRLSGSLCVLISGDSVEDLLLGTAVRSLGRLLQDLCSRSRASKEFGGWSGSVNPQPRIVTFFGFGDFGFISARLS